MIYGMDFLKRHSLDYAKHYSDDEESKINEPDIETLKKSFLKLKNNTKKEKVEYLIHRRSRRLMNMDPEYNGI